MGKQIVKSIVTLAPGKQLQSTGCNWCQFGTRPDSSGICDMCVKRFRALLASAKWNKTTRQAFFSAYPYCKNHLSIGEHVPATELDHILPWRLFPDLFWEETNFQGLCYSCHNFKTLEDKQKYGL